jgi:tetratricopeptide (TPR) repeat protein
VGDRGRARRELERALAVGTSSGERWVEFQTRQQLALELVIDGDYATAADHLDRAIPLGEAIGAHGHVRTARTHRAVALLHGGELDRAIRELEAIAAEGGGVAGAYARNMLAHALRRRGEHQRALQRARRAETGYVELGERAGAIVACVQIAEAAVALGDAVQARSALNRAVEHAGKVLTVVQLAPALPYLLETEAGVLLAEAGADGRSVAAVASAQRLGRAAQLRWQRALPRGAAGRAAGPRAPAGGAAALGPEATEAALADGRHRTGLLPPLD